MDRYQDEKQNATSNKMSRLSRNEALYQDLGSTMKYTTIAREIPAISLDQVKQSAKTREGYHQAKEYGNLFLEEERESKRELQALNSLYDLSDARVYDINHILEQAKKERTSIDEKEKKRNLKNEKYNILTSINEKERASLKQKAKPIVEEEEEEIQELINTITSHNLRKEIEDAKKDDLENDDLLSDLMATSVQDKIEAPIKETIEEKELKGIEDKRLIKDMDSSFYTRSMDLSDKDFDMEEEMDEEMKESKGFLIFKIFLLLLLMAVVIVGAYFIVKSF